jgi:hypothetical protein
VCTPSLLTLPCGQVSWVQESGAQLALHIGDISYARGWGFVWDYFFDLVEPVAATIPYMVCIGAVVRHRSSDPTGLTE